MGGTSLQRETRLRSPRQGRLNTTVMHEKPTPHAPAQGSVFAAHAAKPSAVAALDQHGRPAGQGRNKPLQVQRLVFVPDGRRNHLLRKGLMLISLRYHDLSGHSRGLESQRLGHRLPNHVNVGTLRYYRRTDRDSGPQDGPRLPVISHDLQGRHPCSARSFDC